MVEGKTRRQDRFLGFFRARMMMMMPVMMGMTMRGMMLHR